jgi:hypothetical protein
VGPAWWPPTPPSTGLGLGLYWCVRDALFSRWQGDGRHGHLEEPSKQGAQGIEETGDEIRNPDSRTPFAVAPRQARLHVGLNDAGYQGWAASFWYAWDRTRIGRTR